MLKKLYIFTKSVCCLIFRTIYSFFMSFVASHIVIWKWSLYKSKATIILLDSRTVYEGDCAEEEVGEEDPVDDGGPHDGQDGEDGCCDASPGTQEQPAQISELWYVVGLAVDIIGLQYPVGCIETQSSHQHHHEQTHDQPCLLESPRHGQQRSSHHCVPNGKTRNILKAKIFIYILHITKWLTLWRDCSVCLQQGRLQGNVFDKTLQGGRDQGQTEIFILNQTKILILTNFTRTSRFIPVWFCNLL